MCKKKNTISDASILISFKKCFLKIVKLLKYSSTLAQYSYFSPDLYTIWEVNTSVYDMKNSKV